MPDDRYPTTAQVVCANLIIDDSGILLVRESKPSALGRWSLPAGRLENRESLREGAEREALEETGLKVEARALLGIYHCAASLERGSAITFVFRSVVTGGELRTTADHPEVGFVPRSEVASLIAANQIRGTHVALAIAAADAGIELTDEIVTEVPASTRPKGETR